MKDYVVWLDSKNARIYELKELGIQKSVVRKKEKDFRPQNKHIEKIDYNAEHYYRDLAVKLKGADQLLIMGPGKTKKIFVDHLILHQADTLATKIIGVDDFESIKHKSEHQMLNRARQFYKSYNHFGID